MKKTTQLNSIIAFSWYEQQTKGLRFMGLKDSVVVFSLLVLTLIVDSNGGQEKLSREEDLELEKQLKMLNKPAVKTIKTENGDIFDCVDIYKQPAFDHPLLKNHKLRKRPSFMPKEPEEEAASMVKSAMIGLPDGGCPEGYIPIRRTTKNELVKARIFFNYNREVITPTAKPPYAGNVAILKWRGKEKAYGTRFALNVWGLQVDKGQFSASNVWILHGCDFVNAGWIVNPDLFGDSKSRLFINWTVDCYKKTGCFNMLCPGFVQIDTEFPLGMEIGPLSVYRGPQYELKLDLFKDLSSGGDWWLVHGGDKPIGYWPSELLTNLSSYSEAMAWGGYVYGPTDRPSPAMGSGHFPYEGYGVGCFFRGIKLMDMYRAFYTPRDKYLSHAHTRCYGLETGSIGNKDWGRFVYFGGPTCRPP